MPRDKFVTVKVTEAERARWRRLAESRGKKLGAVIREYLDRACKREEKRYMYWRGKQ